MGLTRNQRRKAKKAAIEAKRKRLERAASAVIHERTKAIVVENNRRGVETKNERIERLALRCSLAKMTGKPHLARELVKNAAPYRRMAMQRWIDKPIKSKP